jgi:hypothetical protein
MEVPVSEPNALDAQPDPELSALDADSASAVGGTRDAELVEEAAEHRGEPDARTLFQREADRTRGRTD